jgi:hypothetical protein
MCKLLLLLNDERKIKMFDGNISAAAAAAKNEQTATRRTERERVYSRKVIEN